jgi:poly(A) polymerase/tRNA nucleotidyltransferase (CCA-adding enzyme)
MSDALSPRQPHRPLRWPEVVTDLRDALTGLDRPVYIVGGAVRDALLGRPLKDLDLAVPDGGAALARRIANRMGGAFFPLDSARDVGRALLDTGHGRLVLDVARFRGADLYADLADRDFTINAMAADLRADLDLLIDPLNGEQDARAKVIRRCGPQSLADDPVRCLRAVRLSAQLGMRIEPATVQDVRRYAPLLADASPERVRDELFRLLALPQAAAALRAAAAVGLIAPVLPGLHHTGAAWTRGLGVIAHLASVTAAVSGAYSDNLTASFGIGLLVMQLGRFEPQLRAHFEAAWPNDRPHQALLALIALLYTAGLPPLDSDRAAALRLSSDERARAAQVMRGTGAMLALDAGDRRVLHRFWRDAGPAGVDMCLLSAVDFLAAAGNTLDQDAWLAVVAHVCALLDAYFNHFTEIVAPPPLLDGLELMRALDVAPGPAVGALLAAVREAQAAGEVRTADEALALARAQLSGGQR